MKLIDEKYKPLLKTGLIIATYCIVLYLALSRFDVIAHGIHSFFSLLMPFWIGLAIAFILNLMMSFFEDHVFKFLDGKKAWKKLRRPVCLIITYLLAFSMIFALFSILVPELWQSINRLVNNLNSYVESAKAFVNQVTDFFNIEGDSWSAILDFVDNLVMKVGRAVQDALPQILTYTKNFTANLVNWIMGIIISIYLLADKENLLRRLKNIMLVLVPEKRQARVLQIATLISQSFSGFIAGRVLESLFTGFLCFIGMSLFRMPYALLISVIVGVTNIIPVFGPLIGAIPGAFIILIADPGMTIWFILFIIVLQQLDGNVIGPMILSDSIGLPGLWVIFAIVVGNGLMGVPGMILGIPFFAVFYALFRDFINRRLTERGIAPTETSPAKKTPAVSRFHPKRPPRKPTR